MGIPSDHEEKLHALTHGVGALLGLLALILLMLYDTGKTRFSFLSVGIYGVSIIVLFSASTLYHTIKNEKKRHLFRIIDHISIYFLIAGTYTPVLLITLEPHRGWPLFYIVWAIAIFGVVLKLFFTGRFEIFSTALYLVMGWLIVFDFSNLTKALGNDGMLWFVAGGLAYTLGIVFYALRVIPYNHVIWHVFVLAGALSHFFMIFFYVI